jgi:hypothetical protein
MRRGLLESGRAAKIRKKNLISLERKAGAEFLSDQIVFFAFFRGSSPVLAQTSQSELETCAPQGAIIEP